MSYNCFMSSCEFCCLPHSLRLTFEKQENSKVLKCLPIILVLYFDWKNPMLLSSITPCLNLPLSHMSSFHNENKLKKIFCHTNWLLSCESGKFKQGVILDQSWGFFQSKYSACKFCCNKAHFMYWKSQLHNAILLNKNANIL